MLTMYEKATLTKENSKSFSEPRRIFTKTYDLEDTAVFPYVCLSCLLPWVQTDE